MYNNTNNDSTTTTNNNNTQNWEITTSKQLKLEINIKKGLR